MKILFVFSLLGALFGGIMLLSTFFSAESAPQQAAGAAIAIGLAVIPYCLARSLEKIQQVEAQNKEKKV